MIFWISAAVACSSESGDAGSAAQNTSSDAGVLDASLGSDTGGADTGSQAADNSSDITSSGTTVASADSGVGAAGEATLGLLGAPLLFAPTTDGFGISVALTGGDPTTLRAHLRAEGASDWGKSEQPKMRAEDLAEWRLSGLEAGTRYEYQIVVAGAEADTDAGGTDGGQEQTLYEGSVVTAREPGTSFSFALLTDSHIGAHLDYGNQGIPDVLAGVSAEIAGAFPDFMMNLGDMLDFHQYGFNAPPPDGSITRLAYLNYRELMGNTLGSAPHFPVIGNWEGENGNYTPEEIAWSREQRVLYMPAPNPSTYDEGGSPNEDYYAFTWGDALFVVLNVMTYTPTEHLLTTSGGTADDWTLGEEQLAWLTETLENAKSKWRFLAIHHAVGGAAGNEANAAYGRGGGQAAHVGEQAVVHQLMIDHGVQIFFYGHDHVFTDMVVDDIHYTMPGSAGAPWMFTEAETGYTQSWLESGWANVDVTPDSVDVQFIALGGEVIYEYTLE